MEGTVYSLCSHSSAVADNAVEQPRYLRFSNNFNGSRSSVSTTASSTRPTTSGSINSSSATTPTGATKSGLERSQSTHHVSALATAVAADAARQWTLTIFKQKVGNDHIQLPFWVVLE